MSHADSLGPYLDRLYGTYATPSLLSSDPLQALYRYEDPVDREVVGYLASSLSFGRVAIVLGAIDRALSSLGSRPSTILGQMTAAECVQAAHGFNHRWIFAEDLANLFIALGSVVRIHGSLEPAFAQGMESDAADVRSGAETLVNALRSHLPPAALARRGTRYLLPDAMGNSACKRLHLFLRWMVRSADVDTGLWKSARPSQLLMPVDTHVARISRYIGLTARRTADVVMALEITASLRKLDPEDPVKYDFALSRLGILGECPRRRQPVLCAACALLPVCRL